jgi:hypothetical protein
MAAVVCFITSGFKSFIKELQLTGINVFFLTGLIQSVHNTFHSYCYQSSADASIESKYLVGLVRIKKTEILVLKHNRAYESVYEN